MSDAARRRQMLEWAAQIEADPIKARTMINIYICLFILIGAVVGASGTWLMMR
jgi:hypothetical protein